MEPAVWMAGGGKGLFVFTRGEGRVLVDSGLEWPGILARGQGQIICACESQRQAALIPLDERKVQRFIPAPPGIEAMEARNGYLYFLSGETDSVLCCREATGEPLFGNKAGVYPRDMRLHPTRPLAVIAGGASGDVCVYALPGLELVRRVAVPGIACQAAFSGEVIVVMCAVGEGDINTLLGVISPIRDTMEEIASLPGLPGALYPLPDGTVLAAALGTLSRFRLKPPKLLWQSSRFGLIRHIEARSGQALITDPLWEQSSLVSVTPPYLKTILSTNGEEFCIFEE